MKKLLSVLLVLVLSFSMLAVTASADNVLLLDPIRGDLIIPNGEGFITTTLGSDGYISGRTFKTTETTGKTFANGTNKIGHLSYKAGYTSATTGEVVKGDAKPYWDNSFSWEFDFNLKSLKLGTNSQSYFFDILFGTASSPGFNNMIRFYPNSSGNKYTVRWFGNYPISSASATTYDLDLNKIYHLKIEADLRNDRYMYVTFTNPETGFTKTTKSPCAIPEVFLSDGTLNTVLRNNSGAIEFELTNEKFYMDRFTVSGATVAYSNNEITASASATNTTGTTYYTRIPILISAIYNSNDELIAYDYNNEYVAGIPSKTAHNYSTTMSTTDLPNGTYTVKAFVWNNLDKMQPYDNCLVEKTLTVSGGVATLSE